MDFLKDPANVVWLKLAVFVVIVGASIGLGHLLAKLLRLRDIGGRFSLILFTFFFGLSPFINALIFETKLPLKDRPLSAITLGIDLAGGTNLVYQLERPPTADEGNVMDKMVGSIRKRIDPGGVRELVIRQVGRDRVELIIPRATPDEIERYKRLMQRQGNLQFHLLADSRYIDQGHADLIREATNLKPGGDLRRGGAVVAGWRPVGPGENLGGGGHAIRPLPNPKEGEPTEEVLVVIDPNRNLWVTGDYLVRSVATPDESGRPSVSFAFDSRGATRFSQLTSRYKPRGDGNKYQLAILLDGVVRSAPAINQTISANGVITGNFTRQEVDELVGVLNAGALDIPLKKSPISENSVSPTLGINVQRSGLTAMAVAALSVVVFMLLYYRWAGLVANIALILNLVLLFGAMSMIEATLTLPGLAGIVLTVGLAVDSNVLIFERIREELKRGSSLRMAIHNGFARAFSSIFDSNITTLLVSVILYMIGSDQVKGFAVTLFIGIALSLYTSLYVSRFCLELIERRRWLTTLKMAEPMGETHFDFVRYQVFCWIASAAVIAAGLMVFFGRGEASYDIDFTGGTMVTMEFAQEPKSSEEVRLKLEEAFQSSISLEQLTKSSDAGSSKLFRMRTTEQDQDAVTKKINAAFGDALKKVTVNVGEVKALPVVADAETPAAAPEADDPAATPGHQVELTFSDAVPPDTIAARFSAVLGEIKNPQGGVKYGDAEQSASLFTLTGSAEEVAALKSNEAQRYKKMTLTVEPALAEVDLRAALVSLRTELGSSPIFEEVNNFEGLVANEAKRSAVLAIALSLIMIIVYIWFRFQNLWFGLAAVLALFHDVIAVLGLVAIASLVAQTPIGPLLMLSDFKINLTMVAAFMTIVGYSLNDTIVIFDRLREIRGKNPLITKEMINLAVNQTLSRTLLTAFTTFLVVGVLYIFGGEGIHGFAFAMCAGVIIGAYSTVYIASPFILVLMDWERRKMARKQQQRTQVKAGAPG